MLDEQLPAAPLNVTVSRSPSATLKGFSGAGFRLFSGILNDIQSRVPFYLSDWKDAWNYRVIPAIVLIFFAK